MRPSFPKLTLPRPLPPLPPLASHKDEIVTAVQFHEVAVLRGETGTCGILATCEA